MIISYRWLQDYLKTPLTISQLTDLLTSIGLEVESVEPYESIKGGLMGVVVGKVLTCTKHPNADKLSLTTVEISNGAVLPIVCGAPNVAAGQKVLVATVGTTLYPTEGEPFTIKSAKIRGEVSEGMLCSASELGISAQNDGIMVLPETMEVGTPAVEALGGYVDQLISIGLTPNRVDAASHLGVARDAYAGISTQLPHVSVQFNKPLLTGFETTVAKKSIQVEVQNKTVCRRYSGVVVEGLRITHSPDWLRNRLEAIGLRSINSLVDITNYVMHEMGLPMHAFDLDTIQGEKVVVRNAVAGEEILTLDGKSRKLHPSDLVIANDSEPMAIAGIMGAKNFGVHDHTTSVFLEAAYFLPDAVRKTSLLHQLKSDSSFRFERGADPNLTIDTLKRACTLIQQIHPECRVSSQMIDIYPTPINDYTFPVLYASLEKTIGASLPKEIVFDILELLEIKISHETTVGFMVSVPPYRVDVYREADIAEELIRIYGYNRIPTPTWVSSSFLAPSSEPDTFEIDRLLSLHLSSIGFNEILTNSLSSQELDSKWGHKEDGSSVEILNKLSPELGFMRRLFLPSMLQAVLYNINRKQKDLKLYELGHTYHQKGDGTLSEHYKQQRLLGMVITGNKEAESWSETPKQVSFNDIRQYAAQLLMRSGISEFSFEAIEHPLLGPAQEIKVNNTTVGVVGQVLEKIVKSMDIKQSVWYAEIHMEQIYHLSSKKYAYNEIPKYPEVRRDLSLVLDTSVSFEQIQKIALDTERSLLKSIQVFDVYQGDRLEQGKKSYSISFYLQDPSQTLQEAQIQECMQKLITAFEKKLKATLRN